MSAVDRWRWSHPEWTAIGLIGSAWLYLLIKNPSLTTMNMSTSRNPGSVLAPWLVMSVAMMTPAALPTLRHIGLSSRWRRRQLTIGLFVGGQLVIWTLIGTALIVVAPPLREPGLAHVSAALLALAALWERHSLRQRAARSCHLLRPIPLAGREGVRLTASAGVRQALWCTLGCWPVMLALSLGPNLSLPLMMILTGVVSAPLLSRRPRQLRGYTAWTLLLVAVATGVSAG